jgi:lipopolysaccharide/colanic/teichoic acid biosynthesis glycosyltransferase
MHRPWRFLIGSLVVVDVLAVVIGLKLAAWLASQPVLGSRGTPDWSFILLVLPVFSALFAAQGLYDPQNLLGGTREYSAVFRACTYGLLAIVLVSFVSRRIVSREWIALAWALAAILVGSERFAIRRVAYRLRRRGHFIVVGADTQSVSVATQLGQAGSGVRVVGFLDDYLPAGSVIGSGWKVLGPPASLMQVAARTKADEAIVVPQALPWETLQTLLADTAVARNGLRVHLPAGFYDLLTTRVGLSERNHVPLLTVKKARLTPFETIFKLTLDYGVATGLLVILSPVIAASALWLRLQGEATVFERLLVRGRYGRPFTLLSFKAQGLARSMFIRKLPGLINVIGGDLSIVGPRPIASDSGGQGRLLAIRPGLTGPWRQVNDPQQQEILDLYYIRSYSIWLDLQVLFRRVMARAGRRNDALTRRLVASVGNR